MPLIGSPMTRAHIPDLLELGIRQVFVDEYELIDNQLEEIYPVVESRRKTESDVITAGVGPLRTRIEGEHPSVENGHAAGEKRHTNNTAALACAVTVEVLSAPPAHYHPPRGRTL